MFGQSITLDPSNQGWFDNIVKIKNTGGGFEHRSDDALTGIGTWVNANYVYLRTISNNNLSFATNNGGPQMTLTTNGRLGIGSNLIPDGQLDVERGTGTSGTAAFRGTQWISHFNYSTAEDTYIRGGQNGSKVLINDLVGLGNVGIGTANPTKAFLVVDKKIGATHAIFGENTSGVSIESSWPGISFNGYYNGARKPLSNGFVGGMAMNPSTGLISIYNTFASGTAGNNVTTQDLITMDNFGKVGIGNSSPQAKLHVTGNMRVDNLAGSGKVQLYADDQGTVSGVLPIAFSAYNSNNLAANIATGVETTFPFASEEYDLGGFYNNATYEFSAPTNGIYHFDAFVKFGAVSSTTSSAVYSLYFYIDTALSSVIEQPIFVGSFNTLNFSQDVKLNAGQKVKIRVIQTSGNTLQLLGGGSSKFTGHLAIRL
ncbi:hypothetical protein EGI31_13550 [Lacihabitans soyangensis]|uniref:C1q domain-containing protein n=2 Tax=Lacihabitans soyangensis TaxID=869394 RepID=A0AAE3H4L1_9BACT|nr:hypothetical protein [Lacihabitans soyangensis]